MIRNSLRNRIIRFSVENIDLVSHRFKHFSFAIVKNKIISIGWNQSKSHSLAAAHDFIYPVLHSEVHALTRLKFFRDIYKHLIVANVRLNNRGEVMLSKPCWQCQKLLKNLKVKEVWYSEYDGSFSQLQE